MAALLGGSLHLALTLALGGEAEIEAEVRPTLAEIFRPPRLLGVRPQRLSISASGRFALWR